MQNEQFILDLRETKNEEDCQQASDILIQTILNEPKPPKKIILNFLQKVHDVIKDNQLNGNIKLYTLLIFKQILKNPKASKSIFTLLSNHKLMQCLLDLAIKVDPNKPISQKGKQLFQNDKQIGNLFIRLILESLIKWSQIYKMNQKQQPTNYLKIYNSLEKQKIVLPKYNEFIYYQIKQKNINKKIQKKNQPIQKNYGNQITYIYKKIENLMTKIDQNEQTNEVEQQIISCHNSFEKQLIKIDNFDQNILMKQPIEKKQLLNNISYFMIEEKQLFQNNFSTGKLTLYISKLESLYHSIFESGTSKRPIKKQISQMNKIQKTSQEQKNGNSKLQNNNNKRNERKNPMIEQNKNSSSSLKTNSANIMTKFFTKINELSQNKNGFQIVSNSIEKQKQYLNLIPGISRRKTLQIPKNKYITASVLKTSTIADIFNSPPNINIAGKSYQGQLIIENIELQKILYQIKNQQGIRKFKIINFRDKHLLMQNENIQIGYKSQAIYQQIQQWDSIISIELYLGNKGTQSITNLQINYTGDQKSMIFTNPKTFPTEINSGNQLKLEMMIIPKCIPFGFINMRLSYKYKGCFIHTMTILPNSILKLITYSTLTINQFNSHWQHYQITFKTQPFKLSKHFPPKQLINFIPALIQLNNYSQFIQQNSIVDFQLGCSVLIKQLYSGLLKIIIRPNLNCILQVKLRQNQNQNFKFFLQTLQMIMRSTQS